MKLSSVSQSSSLGSEVRSDIALRFVSHPVGFGVFDASARRDVSFLPLLERLEHRRVFVRLNVLVIEFQRLRKLLVFMISHVSKRSKIDLGVVPA